jgi:hypothetical protein
MAKAKIIIPVERIAAQIYLIRGQTVMFDANLAALYGVDLRALNQAVRRNKERFPEDVMFQLTWEETKAAKSQNVILNDTRLEAARSQNVSSKRGTNIKYRPLVFTEQGSAT